MKRDIKSIVMFDLLKGRIGECLSELLGQEQTRKITRKAKKEYREMVLRAPEIGGKRNMNYTPLLTAMVLFSFQKVSAGSITEKVFDKMVDYLVHWSILLKTYASSLEFSDKTVQTRMKWLECSSKENYEADWIFTFEEKENEHILTYSRCGICELAKRENCFAFAKYICQMDYTTYDKKGAVLHRSRTIANGDELCDFVLSKKV